MEPVRAFERRETIFAHASNQTMSSTQSSAQRLEFCWMTLAEASQPDFLRAWDDLANNACEPNPFYESWFAIPSFAAFSQNDSLQIAVVFVGGELAGILPMHRSSKYYGYSVPHVSNWLHNNAFCGVPLIRKGAEEHFWTQLLHALDAEPGRSLFMHLRSLPADGPAIHALDAILTRSGRAFSNVQMATRAMLASPLSPDAYLSHALTTKRRKELRRQLRRLADKGTLIFEREEGQAAIDCWITEFLQLEASGWKGDAGSALHKDEKASLFFRTALSDAAVAGKLERLTLRLDGHAIAMLANLISPPGAYSFKTAFDENYASHSPGVQLQLENLALLNRTDIDWTDSCALEGHSMIERIWTERRQMISRNIAIGGRIRRMAFTALSAYETRKRSET